MTTSTVKQFQKAHQVPNDKRDERKTKKKQKNSKQILPTILGLYNVSHIPYNASEDVPERTKSSAKRGAPIRSIALINGLLFLSNPATTGSTKNGPNLFS
mmetsp:Transcript_4605/g.5653  ORF Transcript_4605/g.5653 Transcript_4605/m.5653 type:complete len:100 (+) Transcript_4605:171-470(+)